jgi:hypothetical protein
MCSHRVLACALMTALMVGRASAQTPGIYGFRDDDRGTPRCRWGGTLAFTQAGVPSILVCGDRFRLAFRWNPEWTEIVVIHEFLHALGLGENPPTSHAITERVNVRCGD